MVSMTRMVVWSTVVTGSGDQSAVRDGMTMMPESSADSWDTTLMVRCFQSILFCTHTFSMLFPLKLYHTDAASIEDFANLQGTPTILSNVDCSGSEDQLRSCKSTIPSSQCAGAGGVTCGRSSCKKHP